VAYVKPTGITTMAFARQKRQVIIEVTHKIVGIKFVNPSVVFKKPLAPIPNITDKNKKIYPDVIFII
tara:strand:+ start:21 stop:221 length:201 start_codon:yes stop_codon:yes gene_type:complete